METSSHSTVNKTSSPLEVKRGFPLLFALFPILAGILPILAGYALQSKNEIFMGYSKSEYAAHAAFIKFSSHGDFGNPFNLPEETPASWFNLVHAALGAVAAAGIPVCYLNTLSILIAAIFLVFASWKLVCYFFPDYRKRAVAYLLITCGSGLGWILFFPYFILKYYFHVGEGWGVPAILLIGRHTYDLSFSYVSTIQTVMHPLNTFEIALIAVFIVETAKALEEKSYFHLLYSGMAVAGIAFIHPYSIPVLAGVTALMPVWAGLTDRKLISHAVGCCLILSPFFGLSAYRLYQHSDIIGKISAILTHDHIPVHKIFLAYGLILVFSLWGIKTLWNRRRPIDMMVLSQILILAALFYGPYRPHKYLAYMIIPLSLAAAAGIENLLIPFLTKRFAGNPTSSVLRLVFILVVPSNLIFFGLFMYWVGVDGRNELYVSRDDFNAIRWIEKNAEFRDVVLSSYINWDRRETINYPARYLPQAAGVTTMYTEKSELIADDRGKEKDILAVFDAGTSEKQRKRIFERRKVDYVYYGPREKLLGKWNPEKSNLVEKALDTKTVDIFRVKKPGLK